MKCISTLSIFLQKQFFSTVSSISELHQKVGPSYKCLSWNFPTRTFIPDCMFIPVLRVLHWEILNLAESPRVDLHRIGILSYQSKPVETFSCLPQKMLRQWHDLVFQGLKPVFRRPVSCAVSDPSVSHHCLVGHAWCAEIETKK